MQPADDSALLRQFVEDHSNEAFGALVSRHVNLVYSVALRQVGQPYQAEEISQAVFIILAKKAAGLRAEQALTSWLFRTTRLTANNFIRSEMRRRRREQEAYMQSVLDESTPEVWPRIAPLLDGAVGSLREKDRRALLLRFYEGRNLREVGDLLGASEEAAEKRVSRALEKLRSYFAKRGVDSTTDAITSAIAANSIQIAPTALAKTATTMALAKGLTTSTSTLSLVKGALKIMAWTQAKTAIVAGTIAVLAVGTTTITAICLYKPTVHLNGMPSDWVIEHGNQNQWAWSDGEFNGHSVSGDSMLVSSKNYGDVTLSATVSTTNRQVALALRMEDAADGYFAIFIPNDTVWANANRGGRVILGKRVSNNQIIMESYRGDLLKAAGQSAKLTFSAKGSQLAISLNDHVVLQRKDTDFTSGGIGLRVYGEPGKPCDATFSNVTFR